MRTQLLPTQVLDVAKLVNTVDLPNYSEPGTGKTLTTIGAIEAIGLDNGIVVAPPIALPMWQRVIEQELGAVASILKSGRETVQQHEKSDFLVMSYQMATTKRKELLEFRRRKNAALVLDESHYLKTHDSKRTMAMFGPMGDGVFGLYEQSHYCFTLTGTPIERYADDLWSQLRAVQGDALNKHGVLTYADFRQRFTYSQIKQYNPRMAPVMAVVASKNMEYLNKLLYEEIGIIRRVMSDVVSHMPPVTFREIACECKIDQQTAGYLKGRTVAQIGQALMLGDHEAMTARRLLGLAKLQAVAQYVLDSAANGPVVVGYWHTEFGVALAAALRKAGVATGRIGGDLGMEHREQVVNGFNEGSIRVVVGQIAAMGVSLNLQHGGRHVIIGEDDWSPSKIEQFYKRVWRMGQTEHVQVDFCVADTAIDEALKSVRESKGVGAGKILTGTT